MNLEYFNIIFAFVVVILLLSLVITLSVQIAVAWGGLRGKNLIWGVTKVLERSPILSAHAAVIADTALRHPAITPTGKIATAIGSKELIAVLQDLAADTQTSLEEGAKERLKEALQQVVPQETQDHAQRLADEFKALFPAEAGKMNETLDLLKKKANKLTTNFDTWFDTVMNRTTDRFVGQTRKWTVGFSVVLAIGLQVDSLDLLKKLSSDVELRTALIQTADRTLERADQILLAKPIAVEAFEAVREKFSELKSADIPLTLATRSQGLAWLASKFNGSANLSEMEKAYAENFDRLTPQRLKELGDQLLAVKGQLEVSRLVFLPTSWSEYANRWGEFFSHIPGIIISVLLLSLGAPFWFNALRTLATLRPVLAGKTDPSKLVST